MDISAFLTEAKRGVVTVEYTRIDTGETRIMPCTLSTSLTSVIASTPPFSPLNQDARSDRICVWAVDRAAWRDVIVDTIISWYPGFPKA